MAYGMTVEFTQGVCSSDTRARMLDNLEPVLNTTSPWTPSSTRRLTIHERFP